jgi:hypothetical protein|nr:MAG TPA: hypothetical protein [Caudoviricetes sp.]
MKYRTKVIINGAELRDEQKDNATSITGVSVTGSCGNGFQIGSTASSMLEFTVIKPYKESFDGDKVDLYVLPMESEEEESRTDTLEAEVGDREETEHIEDTDEENDVDTEETEDTDEEAEDVTEAEEAESEAEMDALELNLYDVMNGEAAEEGEGTEEEAVPEGDGWDILGTFYVFKQQNNNDGTVTLQCFDGFQLMNDPYIPAQKNGTFQQFYDDIRAQCQAKGIIVDEETFEAELNPVLEWNQDCTLREAIGYLAGLQGGFATFGDDNTLGISYFGYNDEVLLTSELLSRTTTSAGETMVDGIVCTVNLKQDTIEAGEGGQSLYMYNPFMTQELLDNIFSQYRGIRYTGAVLQARWDPSLVPGEFVRIMTDSEYKNYVAMNNAMANSAGKTAAEILNLKKEINAVGKSLLVSTQKITFGGETTAEIRSHLMTETEKANAPLSPSDAKFRVVTADLIRTKELIAQKAEIEDLKATNALIKNLQATDATITGKVTAAEANIESVKADYVKASEFDVKTATIAKAEIGKATIKDAQLESINGNKIEDGSIVAAALSKEVIKNFNNSNVYYQAEAPEGTELKEGDIWYKTLTKASGDRAGVIFVYDGIEWVNKPFDSESILAGSITAAEIAANTITASQINMENLQTNMARIGEATKNNVLITEKDVQIRNGKKVVASYGDSIRLGEATGQHISVDNSGLAIQDGDKKQFEVRTITSGQTFTDVWLDEGRISPDSGLDTSKVFSAAEIDSALDSTYYDEEILNLTFPSQGVPKVTLIFGGGNSGYNVPTGSSNAIYFTAADQDIEGKSLKLVIDYRDNPSGVTGGFNWLDLSAIKVEYTINFTPTTARIGDGATEDTFINDGTPVNSFKALKVGKGMSREGNWQNDNAFDVDFNGNAYIGGSLNVNGDTETQVLYAGMISCLRTINCKELIAAGPEGEEVSFTLTTSGTGAAKATTGSVSIKPKWWRCGNLVQMEFGVATTGAVNPGKNLATGTITKIPRPVTTYGLRAVSYYGNNANVLFVSQEGSFTVRNCGSDALAKGNDAIGIFTYITDGTML